MANQPRTRIIRGKTYGGRPSDRLPSSNVKLLRRQIEEGKKLRVAGQQFCLECGRPMKLRTGPYGKFWGCTGYPTYCKETLPILGKSTGRPPSNPSTGRHQQST